MTSRLTLAASLAASILCGCAGNATEFRPAKNAGDFPAVKDAYRVPSAPPECESIGTVHAKSKDGGTIEDLAATAARHGGTHYVVRGDRTDVTGYTGTYVPIAAGITSVGIEEEKTRTMWAVVYRCAN